MGKGKNIDRCFKKFTDTFSPKIIGELNGQYVLEVKLEEDMCPLHTHENEDEMFYVLEGILDIYEDQKKTRVKAGEFYIVYQGTAHRVVWSVVFLMAIQIIRNRWDWIRTKLKDSKTRLTFIGTACVIGFN